MQKKKVPKTLFAVNLMSLLLRFAFFALFSFQSADTSQDVMDIVDLQVSVK